MRVHRWHDADDVRRHAAEWDDLWWRSDVALPTTRAETAAHWIEHFSPTDVRVVAVEDAGRLCALAPVVGGRVRGTVPIDGLAANPWSTGGALLLDPSCDVPRVLDRLVRELASGSRALWWFDDVPLGSPAWEAFADASVAAGGAFVRAEHHEVALIDTAGSWEAYERSRSKSLRKNTRRRLRALQELGSLELVEHAVVAPGDLEPLLRRAFDVEQRSWKSEEQTTVLGTPGMFEHFLAMARTVNGWGQLRVSLLELDGRPIAFEYGYLAKGTYFPHKISFDDEFAFHAPSQVLRSLQLERFHARADHLRLDALGPISQAIGQWATSTYAVGRHLGGPPSRRGRLAVRAYAGTHAATRRLRRGAGQAG